MAKKGIQMIGTVKLNRCPGIKNVMLTDKEIKAMGKSAFVEFKGTLG